MERAFCRIGECLFYSSAYQLYLSNNIDVSVLCTLVLCCFITGKMDILDPSCQIVYIPYVALKSNPRKALAMEGESIEFPILYYDFHMISGTFTAKTKKLKELLPHPNFKPIQIN